MRSIRALAASAALASLFAVTTSVEGQERTPPDTSQARGEQQQQPMQEQMRQMQQMMPMMSTMMRQIMESTMTALADPETARNLAQFTRNYYEALIERGFTSEEALRIVTSVGFPAMPRM